MKKLFLVLALLLAILLNPIDNLVERCIIDSHEELHIAEVIHSPYHAPIPEESYYLENVSIGGATLVYLNNNIDIDADTQPPRTWNELLQRLDTMDDSTENIPNRHLRQIAMELNDFGYHSVTSSIGGIRYDHFPNNDPSKFLEAVDYMVDLFNRTSGCLLNIEYDVTEPTAGIYLQIDFRYSTTPKHPVHFIGQTVHVVLPGYYYASSYRGGSGAFGMATPDNPIIGKDMVAVVTGVSYLDSNTGNILNSKYIPFGIIKHSSVPSNHILRRISSSNPDINLMLHLTSIRGEDLGWFNYNMVVPYYIAFPTT